MDVYASVRMNDNHFDGAQVEDLPALHHTELTRMRREHPEWVLGDRTSEWFALSWNMAVPEVREHRYTHIEEIVTRYDWDGVELDWQRHAFHLPEDEAYRLRYVLTDLQRRVRQLTDDLAKRRGRPFYLAARVAGSQEMCRRIGYDIPVWIEEGLVDILILGGGAVTDASPEVAAFVEMCRDRGIAVYPGFDSGLPDPFVGPEELDTKDRMRTRAIASRHHRGRRRRHLCVQLARQPGLEAGVALADRLGPDAAPHRQDLRRHTPFHPEKGTMARRLPDRPDPWARCRWPSRKPWRARCRSSPWTLPRTSKTIVRRTWNSVYASTSGWVAIGFGYAGKGEN